MKKFSAILLCVLLALAFTSCSKSNKQGVADYDYSYSMSNKNLYESPLENDGSNAAMDSIAGAGNSDNKGTTISDGTKIIRTVSMTVQTKEYGKYMTSLNAAVTAAGGYIEVSEEENGYYDSSTRYATVVARIPCKELDTFIAAANENGKIVNKSESQKDVTLDYVDTQSRITAYKTEQATLLELLKKSQSLSDTLEIQARLSEVNYQLETYSSQLRVLENKIDYSTVTLDIYEVERVTENEPTMWQEIKNTFHDSVKVLGNTVRRIVVDAVGGIPVIVPTLLLIVLGVFIVVKIGKKIAKKRKK